MASIRVNGVKHQSGAGAHSAKNSPGRAKTRRAKKDLALTEEMGKPFRRGMTIKVNRLDEDK